MLECSPGAQAGGGGWGRRLRGGATPHTKGLWQTHSLHPFQRQLSPWVPLHRPALPSLEQAHVCSDSVFRGTQVETEVQVVYWEHSTMRGSDAEQGLTAHCV